jgi:hypothetical protein
MLSRLAQIAPLGTWALVAAAAFLLLCGFVLLGHAKVMRLAYRARVRSPIAPTAIETALRWMVACLTGGVLLWGLALGWPGTVIAPLGGLVVVALALETIARLQG